MIWIFCFFPLQNHNNIWTFFLLTIICIYIQTTNNYFAVNIHVFIIFKLNNRNELGWFPYFSVFFFFSFCFSLTLKLDKKTVENANFDEKLHNCSDFASSLRFYVPSSIRSHRNIADWNLDCRFKTAIATITLIYFANQLKSMVTQQTSVVEN